MWKGKVNPYGSGMMHVLSADSSAIGLKNISNEPIKYFYFYVAKCKEMLTYFENIDIIE